MAAPVPTVVILLSDKRSGSTIFQTEFLDHRDVTGLAYSSHTYLESHHWLKAAVLLDRPARLFSAGQAYANYGGRRNARTYMIDTIRGNIPQFDPPAEDRALVFEGWEVLCAHHAQPVFFEKSPQVLAHWSALSLLLEWRAQTDFRVKLIGLVRNPLAVLYSAEKLFGSSPLARQFGWTETHRNLLALRAMLDEDALMILRHEDVIADPQEAFGRVCDFVGIARDGDMGLQVTGRTQDAWLDDPEFTMSLDPAVRQIALGLGYDAGELVNTAGHDAAAPAFRPSKPPISRRVEQWKNRLKDRVLRPMLMRRRHARSRHGG